MLRTALVFAALVAGVTGSAQAQDLEALKLDTRKNALPVLPKVVAMMQETVATRGVVEAIPVCKEKAPPTAQGAVREDWLEDVPGQSEDPQPRAGHAGYLGGAPARRFQHPSAAGEKVESLETGEIVTENGKPVFRYMRAIPVGDVCLKCHGQADKIEAG
jgi:hypothetical protein